MRNVLDTATTRLIPTPLERAVGRFMRAPDHDAGGGEGGSDAGAAGGADGGADAADDGSLLGAASGEPGAGDGKSDGKGADADPDAGKGADGSGDKDAKSEADADGPPETYELSLPGGVELDAALLDEATPVLKELGLSNEAANKLVPIVGKVQERILTAQADEFAATAAQWAKDAKADPEIGGRNWDVTVQNAARVMDHYIGPKVTTNEKGEEVPNGFRQLLDDTRLGNHPELIRAFARIGKDMGEDMTFARSGLASPEKKPREAVLYPNDLPKEGAK